MRHVARGPEIERARRDTFGHDAHGEWAAAHQLAQDVDDADGAWIHAYLHRKEGDAGNARWYFPGNTEYTTIKLTRAASEDSKSVKKWLDDTSFNWKPYTGQVVLHDSGANEIMTWELAHVMPVHWQIVGFDAMASKVATETLELAHLGFLSDKKP